MATIDRLPAELLHDIIELACAGSWEGYKSPLALVAKSWLWKAQRNLWQDITIGGDDRWGNCFRTSPARGRHPTCRLCFYGERAAEVPDSRVCVGVRWLHRELSEDLPGAALSLLALTGELLSQKPLRAVADTGAPELTELSIWTQDNGGISLPVPPAPNFQLKSIDLQVCRPPLFPPEFLDFLVLASQQRFSNLTLGSEYDGGTGVCRGARQRLESL